MGLASQAIRHSLYRVIWLELQPVNAGDEF